MAPEICALVREAEKTGEPILRALEYNAPHQGLAWIKDEFMLGEDILAAPVVTPGRPCAQRIGSPSPSGDTTPWMPSRPVFKRPRLTPMRRVSVFTAAFKVSRQATGWAARGKTQNRNDNRII
jgi:hypothetical protein